MTEPRLAAIVLAAGLGARFGGKKLTSAYGGGLLIDGALQAAFAAPVETVLVIGGADPGVGEAAEAAAERWQDFDDQDMAYVQIGNYAEGLSATLKAGIGLLDDDEDGAFIFLGDMPRIPHAILQPMAEALAKGAAAVAPTFQGRRGHPVLFSSALFDELKALEGDKGAGDLLDRLGASLVTVPSPDDGVLFDVDERK